MSVITSFAYIVVEPHPNREQIKYNFMNFNNFIDNNHIKPVCFLIKAKAFSLINSLA